MALPRTRNLTYTNGSPLDSQIVNDLQDGVISAHRFRRVLPFAGLLASGTPDFVDPDSLAVVYNGSGLASLFLVGLGTGETLTRVTVHVTTNHTITLSVNIKNVATGQLTQIFSEIYDGGGTGALEAAVTHTMAPGEIAAISLNIFPGSGQTFLQGLSFDSEKRTLVTE